MNIFVFLSLISSIISFALGNFVFYKNRKNLQHIIFSLFCFSISYWGFIEFMYRQAESFEIAHFWLEMNFIWPFTIALIIHFVLIYTEKINIHTGKLVYFLLYTPALFFTIIELATDQMTIGVVKRYWGYSYLSNEKSLLFWLSNIWALIILLSILFLLISYRKKMMSTRKRKQLNYITIGSFIPILMSIPEIIPIFKLGIPEMSISSLTWFSIFVCYAIWKYELFVIDSAMMAENIIFTMNEALVISDFDNQILKVNPAFTKLFGYKESEVISKKPDIFAKNEEEYKIISDKLFDKKGLKNCEAKCKIKSGELIDVELSGSELRDKYNEVAGVVMIIKDIRERKKYEKENTELQRHLMQSEKMVAVGQLAGGVAHEINNPMGVILGFAQSVVKNIKEGDSLYMPLKSIEREAIRCKKLVSNLLIFSRIEKTGIEIVEINSAIEETISLIDAQAKTRGIEIIKQYASNLLRIKVNRSHIQQVIVNLCNNAMDAMPQGGKITITTTVAAEQSSANISKANALPLQFIVITISDTGVGMSEEVKKHIFEPFYTTKEVGKGTGLGLSICYEIIQKHNGTIEVESEVGKGTTFVVKLPVGVDNYEK